MCQVLWSKLESPVRAVTGLQTPVRTGPCPLDPGLVPRVWRNARNNRGSVSVCGVTSQMTKCLFEEEPAGVNEDSGFRKRSWETALTFTGRSASVLARWAKSGPR